MGLVFPWLVSVIPEQRQYWSEETSGTGQAVEAEDEIVTIHSVSTHTHSYLLFL